MDVEQTTPSVPQQVAALRQRTPNAETVVIVGGGPAGLLTAYLLLYRYGRRFIPVVLDGNFCHARIGGNAYTVPVKVGAFERWVDLGVNDYNAATYQNVQRLLERLGVEGKPLIDTTTWAGSRNGDFISYTDQDLAHGRVACELARDYYRFKAEAYNDAMYGGHFDETLADYAENKEFSPAFLELNLYPRVNGMYYVDQTRPAPEMPLGAIMRYYGLQEGFGTGPADRRYFEQGSTHWLETLADAIRCMGGVVAARCEVKSLSASGIACAPLRVVFAAATCQWWAGTPSGCDEYLDCSKVVMSAHADVVNRLLEPLPDTEGVRDLLRQIHYTEHEDQEATGQPKKTIAIAHTDASVLPDPGKPSTYNITIHESYDRPNPYTITYWCNHHQNDPDNPAYTDEDVPNFYVTINPPSGKKPADDKVLQTTFAAPDGTSVPAIAHFSHNTETRDTAQVQLDICERHQGMKLLGGQLYFAGGWGIGAGLHEECWYAADIAVRRLAGVSAGVSCADLIAPPARRKGARGRVVQLPARHLRVAMGRLTPTDDD